MDDVSVLIPREYGNDGRPSTFHFVLRIECLRISTDPRNCLVATILPGDPPLVPVVQETKSRREESLVRVTTESSKESPAITLCYVSFECKLKTEKTQCKLSPLSLLPTCTRRSEGETLLFTYNYFINCYVSYTYTNTYTEINCYYW